MLMSLGENIRNARKAAGMSQAELGAACGWGDASPQGRIGHYETGRREPSLSHLRDIAGVTGTTLIALIEGVDNSIAVTLAKAIREADSPLAEKMIVDHAKGVIEMVKSEREK